jgi:hypothetical protein
MLHLIVDAKYIFSEPVKVAGGAVSGSSSAPDVFGVGAVDAEEECNRPGALDFCSSTACASTEVSLSAANSEYAGGAVKRRSSFIVVSYIGGSASL